MREAAPGRRPGPVLHALFRIPLPLLRARLGWLLGGRVVLIEHIGRRTGTLRRTALEVVGRDRVSGSVTVASGYGERSDWYRNLRANPRATIVLGPRRHTVEAVPVPPERAEAVMVAYARRYPRLAPRIARMLGYEVDGTEGDYAALGRKLRLVDLVPAAPGQPQRPLISKR